MKHITINDLAQRLGISKSTVSRALGGDDKNIKKETKEKILELSKELGYHKNELAVNLRMKSTYTIGIVVPEMLTPFYMNFITYAQNELKKGGFRVIIAQSNEDPEAERSSLQMLEGYRVDGVLLSVCHNKKNIEYYKQLEKNDIPIVFFDRTITDIPSFQVKIDDYQSSYFMVEHLIRNGRKKIIFLAGPSYIQNSTDRERGYKRAVEKFNLNLGEEYVLKAGLNVEDGEKAMTKILEKNISFDAIFCFTELVALGAKNILQINNIKIPDEVAICCISGTKLCSIIHPKISAVEQPVIQMAEIASQLIMERLSNKKIAEKTITLQAEMILRESTEKFG